MKNLKTTLVSIAVIIVGLFFSASEARADIVSPTSLITDTTVGRIVGAGVGIGIVALISWLVIRAIRRKKNVINK